MHELSLSQGMLEIIEQRAAVERFERVRVVRLELGALFGVWSQQLDALDQAHERVGGRTEATAFAGVGDGVEDHGRRITLLTTLEQSHRTNLRNWILDAGLLVLHACQVLF